MTEFKPEISSVGNDRSANWATTTVFSVLCQYDQIVAFERVSEGE